MAAEPGISPGSFPAGYQYPTLPGTPEWDALKDNQEKIDACVVPQEILDNMTTEEVLETLLNYPLQANISAFNSIQAGVEVVYHWYSGEVLSTLLSRPDRADVILHRYQNTPLEGKTTDETFENSYDQDTMEVLMQMKPIKALYTEEQLLEIERAVSETYLLRQKSHCFSDKPLCEYFRIELNEKTGYPFFPICLHPRRLLRLSAQIARNMHHL